MNEDFGWGGDEFLLGDCQDDWFLAVADGIAQERADLRREMEQERKHRLLEEDEVDDEWDRMNERDLCDIVREHDEQDDWEARQDEEPDDGFYWEMDDY